MKAEELMIGDWVDAFDDEHHISKILELRRFSAKVIAGNVGVGREQKEIELGYEYFYPIQITPEILEKNGFDWTEDNYSKTYYEKESSRSGWHDIELVYYKDDKKCQMTINYGEDTIGEPFKYVHELQNILRSLFKEDKEIVL